MRGMKVSGYQPGVPCWVDLGSPDIDGAKAFYGALFGWTAQPSPPEAGGYTFFHLGDDPVAAVGPLFSAEQPPAWTWYAAVPDADEAARTVEVAGGKVLNAPLDVLDAGRTAVFLDPSGTPFSVWQPRAFPGATRVTEPGAFTWNELMTRNPEAATDFFARVLGWTAEVNANPDMPYTQFQVDGRSIAGMMPMRGEAWPEDLPDHWMVYFGVDDCDASCAKVRDLGGSVSVPPTEAPGIGRFAVAGDPSGAYFSLIALEG
jgi:predicted enzyme related to lactoylglutathione lyase